MPLRAAAETTRGHDVRSSLLTAPQMRTCGRRRSAPTALGSFSTAHSPASSPRPRSFLPGQRSSIGARAAPSPPGRGPSFDCSGYGRGLAPPHAFFLLRWWSNGNERLLLGGKALWLPAPTTAGSGSRTHATIHKCRRRSAGSARRGEQASLPTALGGCAPRVAGIVNAAHARARGGIVSAAGTLPHQYRSAG